MYYDALKAMFECLTDGMI